MDQAPVAGQEGRIKDIMKPYQFDMKINCFPVGAD